MIFFFGAAIVPIAAIGIAIHTFDHLVEELRKKKSPPAQ
jgi:hypothetical protein